MSDGEDECNVLLDSPHKASPTKAKVAAAAEAAPSLNVIWECEKIEQLGPKGGDNEKWTCHHCNGTFAKWNATKALQHVVGRGGRGIRFCTAKIPDAYKER